jgi:hypothetical protein
VTNLAGEVALNHGKGTGLGRGRIFDLRDHGLVVRLIDFIAHLMLQSNKARKVDGPLFPFL